MKKIKLFSVLLSVLMLFSIVACDKKDIPKPKPEPKTEVISPVSQFVYDGLSSYYLWANDMKAKEPTANDKDPKQYFQDLLHPTDIKHDWSWITDDVDALISEFQGEPIDFGYVLTFIQDNNKIYAVIKYVYPNTPIANAGLKRMDMIGEINGKTISITQGKDGKTYISKDDIAVLYGDKTANFAIYNLEGNEIVKKKDVQITPTKIKTDPVLLDTVYTINDKKIGYLFYTNFIFNFNYRLYEAFANFKQNNVTDLIIDLRYNHGGAVASASYLTSLFAPVDKVSNKETLVTYVYNDYLNKIFGSDRNSKLGDYQKENEYDKDGKIIRRKSPNPLGANLNLDKVHIIATGDSYSASELTIFCSRTLMNNNVVHIGSKTGGKYTASWTLHPYDSEKGQPIYDVSKMPSKAKEVLMNWAMQPIVARYTDKNGNDFSADEGLIPDAKNTLSEGWGYINQWKQLGDVNDVLLGQAIYLITGDVKYKPVKPKELRSSSRATFIEAEFTTPHDKIIKESVILDNPKISPTELNELLQLRRAQIQEEEE